MKDRVENLINQAASANNAKDAMAFSQAALNAANALHCLQQFNIPPKKPSSE